MANFSAAETNQLRATFNAALRDCRFDLADELLAVVMSSVGGAREAYAAHGLLKDDASSHFNLGVILLNGIESFMLRMEEKTILADWVDRLTTLHEGKLEVTKRMMGDALTAAEPTFMMRIGNVHDHKNNCPTCATWRKFFRFIRDTLTQ